LWIFPAESRKPASSQNTIAGPKESDGPSALGPIEMDYTPSKQAIKTLPRTPKAVGFFVAVDNGSVRARKKQRKPKVKKAIVAQVLNDANKCNNATSDKKQIVEGIDRLPQIIGYDDSHHMLLPHSLLKYSQHVQDHSKMPFWFVSGIEEFTWNLFEKQLRTKPLFRNNKERNLAADLIFMALPTGLRPEPKMVNVPSWNEWDETLPYHFFVAAKPLLTTLVALRFCIWICLSMLKLFLKP
jgi:hypothetical protein